MRRLWILFFLVASLTGQDLPFRWEDITANDWAGAQEKAAFTCIVPLGILEKHGLHLPLGTDLIHVREWVARAACREYAVVFPGFYFGQIYEAMHQPGTFTLPSRLVWDLLEATCEEIGRNGFKKIVLVNGHGGNNHLLGYFAQAQLERRRNYVVYVYNYVPEPQAAEKVRKLRQSDPAGDLHAGEQETSEVLAVRPDLVRMDLAPKESGRDQQRLNLQPGVYTGIWWYARFPNHYAGEGEKATAELGRLSVENRVNTLAGVIRAIKADTKTPAVQKEFFDRVLK